MAVLWPIHSLRLSEPILDEFRILVPGARLISQIVVGELLEPWETKIGSPATLRINYKVLAIGSPATLRINYKVLAILVSTAVGKSRSVPAEYTWGREWSSLV